MSKQFFCVEYWGRGDPFFGGNAEDRTLGRSGLFLTGSHGPGEVAAFDSAQAAQDAGEAAANRRPGGLISAHARRSMQQVY